MNIRIVAVGKLKESYYQQAVSEYVKRISRFATVEVVEVAESTYNGIPSTAMIDSILDKEATAILSKTIGYVVVLDVASQIYSSEQLADTIAKAKNISSNFTFIIGSSYGLHDRVKNRADIKVSLGKITLPHQLARVVLAEQIYRVMTIHNNITYHK